MILVTLKYLEVQGEFDGMCIFAKEPLKYKNELPIDFQTEDLTYNSFMKILINKLSYIYPDIFKLKFNYNFDLNNKSIKILNSIPDIYFSKHSNYADYVLGYIYENFQVNDKIIANLKSYKEGEKYNDKSLKLKTQIFTPEWICETIVQNSLCRAMIEIDELWDLKYQVKNNLLYYLKSDNNKLSTNSVKKLKILEPSVGAGNMSTLTFKYLTKHLIIYNKLNKRKAVKIALNNIYGLDIDKDSIRIAKFYLQHNANKLLNYYGGFGRLKKLEYFKINIKYIDIENGTLNIDVFKKLDMPNKYDIIIGNPPYGGNKHFNKDMRAYFKKYYPNTKTDLYTMFIEKSLKSLTENGYLSMITPRNWMFLNSNTKLRVDILHNYNFKYLFDLGTGVFDLSGAVVSTGIFVIQNNTLSKNTETIRLVDEPRNNLKYKLKQIVYPSNVWNCDGKLGVIENLKNNV